ncbi:hypothetical protein D1007_33000 [Hordeum vulgare]|nr:hypothetical protein D1007_33000 [Hordeum vulgare]
MRHTITLSAADEWVVPPLPKTEPMEPQREVYQWIGCLREWVSAPPIWLGATPWQEEAYLHHWRSQHLVEERADGRRQMTQEREAEEERREMEEEERARATLPPPRAQLAPAGQMMEAQAAAL